jgi:hypothetical protein
MHADTSDVRELARSESDNAAMGHVSLIVLDSAPTSLEWTTSTEIMGSTEPRSSA